MSSQRAEYERRINRAIDHIEAHLGEPLSLERLAAVASFSPFHFHRVFGGITGETLHRFIQRKRLERAGARLLAEPHTPITDVALDLGFSSPSVFARSFKAHFGCTASGLRKQGKAPSKQGMEASKGDKAPIELRFYLHGANPRWEITMSEMTTTVRVETLPERTVAYVRAAGDYRADPAFFQELWGRLMPWAAARGLTGGQMLSIYHESPGLTEPDKMRVSACIVVPPDTPVSGEVGKMTLPAGLTAIAEFTLRDDQYGQAWEAVYGGWLPESGFVPDDRLPYEAYGSRGEAGTEVAIHVPVRPA